MQIKRTLRHALSPVVDLLLPEGCWAGGTVEAGEEEAPGYGLSAEMRDQIGRMALQPYCFHCGLTVGPYETHDPRNPCGRCLERDAGVVHTARVGTFSGPLVVLVHRLKFGQTGAIWEIARVLAPFLYQALVQISERTGTAVDVMVPVPLHWSRQVRRGFNQAEELSREVAALSGWRMANALRRTRRTQEQARLDGTTLRLENLRGAFSCRRNAGREVAGRHVWLIDDVSTTGATLHAAASALRRLPKEQRPASINAAVVCVTDHGAKLTAVAGAQTMIWQLRYGT